jgi:hypothetical protein
MKPPMASKDPSRKCILSINSSWVHTSSLSNHSHGAKCQYGLQIQRVPHILHTLVTSVQVSTLHIFKESQSGPLSPPIKTRVHPSVTFVPSRQVTGPTCYMQRSSNGAKYIHVWAKCTSVGLYVLKVTMMPHTSFISQSVYDMYYESSKGSSNLG